MYKFDFHLHSSEYSACGRSSAQEQILQAIRHGLDGLCITDHHHVRSPQELTQLRERFPRIKIYAGIEITADDEDWLVYGLTDPALNGEQYWTYARLRALTRKKGGFVVLAHPFRYVRKIHVDLEADPPDGIEYRSRNTPVDMEAEILELAGNLQIPAFCNSDAHHQDSMGVYFNRLNALPADDEELVRYLRALAPAAYG